MKSVMAGLYTAPPAQEPMITLIWGTTPDASTLRLKMPAEVVESDDAFLYPGPAAVVDADHGHPDRGGQVHDLVDLLAEDLAERTRR